MQPLGIVTLINVDPVPLPQLAVVLLNDEKQADWVTVKVVLPDDGVDTVIMPVRVLPVLFTAAV